MNQASMFFTAVVMLAGAGWYVLASNGPPAGTVALASAVADGKPAKAPKAAAAKAPLVAQAPPLARTWPSED